MKLKNYLFVTILIFCSANIYSQIDGDFRSFQTGDWNTATTWERYDGSSSTWEKAGVGNNNPGQIPTSTTDVWEIQATHTVTIVADAECKNITITGTLNGDANTLSVYGNLTNNGTLNLYAGTGTALVFAGTGDAIFSGTGATTDIYTIEVNKDLLASTVQLSTNNFSVQDDADGLDVPKFLTLTTGTFRLAGTFAMTSELFIGGAEYSFNDDEGFWLDNANFTIIGQAGQIQFNGLCRISAGTFNSGDAVTPYRFYMNNSSSFIMEGGTLNINGAFYAGNDDPITYNQSGGTINAGLINVTDGGWSCFRIDNANADFTMSAGTINLVQTNSSEREYQVDSDPATHVHITGGTLNVGTAATAIDFTFELDGSMPNAIIHGNATARTRDDIYIYNDLTVNGIMTYRDANNEDITVYGDLLINASGEFNSCQTITSNRTQNLYLYGSLISNGQLYGSFLNGSGESRLFAYFMGNTDETITGTGVLCLFHEIVVNKGNDMTATLEVLRPITIDAADNENQRRLYVENGTFKLSSASNLIPYYNGQRLNSTTGRFWINHVDAVISWANVGNAQSNGEFIMDAGTFNAGNNFLINGNSTTNNQINGGTINVPQDFDMEQDVLMTAGILNITRRLIVDANGADEYGDLTMQNGTINVINGYMLVLGDFEMADGNLTIGDGDDYLYIYNDGTGTGTMKIDGGTIQVNGYVRIRGDATANSQFNGGNMTVTGNFDMKQDLLITGGTLTVETNFYMDGNDGNESGDLTITNGTLNVGDGNDIFQATGNGGNNGEGGSFTMSNGTVNVFGRVLLDNGTGTEVCSFNMSGGNFNIDPQHTTNLANNVDLFIINNNSVVNFTGGILTFIDPHADKKYVYIDAIEIRGQTGAKNFVGSTICFGDGVSNSSGDDLYPGYSIYVANNFDLQFGNIILNNPAGTQREFYGRTNTNILCNNLTITTANDKYIMNGKNLEVSGDFINNGELDGTVRNSNNHLLFTGTTAQEYSGTGFLTSNLNQLTFNNTSATGVTLSADIGADIINLTDGHIYSSTTPNGLLTVFGTAPANLVGGTSANYVQGPLRRAIPNNASSTNYDFPVGKANYRLFELIGLKTTGTGDGFITSEFFPTTAEPATGGNGMADPLESNDIHWKINNDLSSINITHVASVRLTYPVGAPPPVYTIAQSNTLGLNKTYDAIGRIITPTTIQSEEYKVGAYATNAETYLCIGAVEPLEGTYTVGNSGDFLNLTEVAAELRIKYVNDWVVFEMLADYEDDTETFPVDFDILMLTEPKYNVTIRPRTGVEDTETALDGFGNGAEIYINHIHDLRFDGRPGGVGTGDWLFAHEDATPAPVFSFNNNAYADTLSFLTIKSDIQTTTSGVIHFSADGGNGNDNIVIDNCDITGRTTTPTNAIYSQGNVGSENDNNKIDNCNIYDFFNATENCNGIFIDANNTDWTIVNNKFYQTAPRVFTETQTYYGISINSGSNYTIDNNTIGYSASDETGYTEISGSTGEFCAILYAGDNGTNSNIINNTISGIKFSTASTNTANGFFNGIFLYTGDANIGTAGNGNLIGEDGAFTTTNYPIQITVGANNGQIVPIFIDANRSTNIRDNQVAGIKTFGNQRHWFIGIQTAGANTTDYSISNNTIGSATNANSINIGQTGNSVWHRVYGIYNYESDVVNINNNTIANITNNSTETGANNTLYGIYARRGSNIIDGNTIYSLTTYSGLNYNSYVASLIGISRASDDNNQQIINNEIYGLKNNYNDGGSLTDNRNVVTIGIAYRSCMSNSDEISRNFIHNFGVHSSNEDAIFTGIHIAGTDRDNNPDIISNNMIQLGIDETGASIQQPLRMYGINYDIDAPVDFYHNSIYIGGANVYANGDNNASGDDPDSTFCIYKRATSLSTMKNNIFENVRSNVSGIGAHYCMLLSYEDVVNANYNIYNVTGTGGVLANLDGTDFITMRAMKAYAGNGNDFYSGFGSANFIAPEGNNTTCNLHLGGVTPAEGMGEVSIITTDIDGEVRSSLTPVDIGADAGNYTFDATVDIYPPNFAYEQIDPQICDVEEVFIDVRITDQGTVLTGVPTAAGTNKPRAYYRDNAGTWAAGNNVEGVLQSGDGHDGIWRFTFTGLSNHKYYEYYFVAEDQANNPSSETANGASTTNNVNIGYSKFAALTPINNNVNTVVNYPDPANVEIDVFTVCVFPLLSEYTVGNDAGCIAVLGHECHYENLTGYDGFFFQMNAMLIDKDVTCKVVADTDEPAIYPANQFFDYDPNDLTAIFKMRIIPNAPGTVIKLNTDESVNKKMIRLEGADRYTFDGQYYNAGVADGNRWLEFSHDKNDQSVFYFKDDAQTDTVQYLIIKGSGALDPRGTVYFDSTTVAVPEGNKDIVIHNNQIFAHTKIPLNAVYSSGGGGANNANIQITNNEIDAFQNVGIWVTDQNNDNWTISNNIIYNTFANDTLQAAISINSGSGYTIDGNQIGGSDASLGGAPMANTYKATFNAIYLDTDEDVVSNITNNTIKNIACSQSGSGNHMRGIRVEAGQVNITGNTLKNFTNNRNNYTYGISYSGASGVSISNNTVTDFTTTGNGHIRAIYLKTDEDNLNSIQNNTVSNFNMTNTGAGIDFYGIYNDVGMVTVTGNTIGGANPADKITFAGGHNFRAIYVNDADGNNSIVEHVENNQILNIETIGNSGFMGIGLYNMEDEIAMNFQNNTIDNISLNCSGNAFGFYINDGLFDINNNTIGTATYGISNSGTGHLYGMTIPMYESNFSVHNNTVTNLSGNANINCISTPTNNITGNNIAVYDNTVSGHTINSEITFIGINLCDNNHEDMTVNGNIVTDITMTNTGDNTEFIGIRFGNNIDALVGNTYTNTVGHTTTANSITIAGGTAKGISFENYNGTITATNNLVANITATGDNAVIQGIVPANSGGTLTVSTNIVRDLTATGTGDNYVAGIYIDNNGTKTISQNSIYDLTTTSQKLDISDGILASQGIHATGSSSASITENIIYNISASGIESTNTAGISENATNVTITKNKIYGISNTSTAGAVGNVTASGIVLYKLNAGYVANNMISIGENDGTEYSGIWIPQTNTNAKNIYFNSIYIGGTANDGNSYGFLRGSNTTPLYLRNNIFSNFRDGGTGLHYSFGTENIAWSNTYAIANCYYTVNDANTAKWNDTDIDFETLLTNIGEDGTYLSTNQMPKFTNASNCDLHLNAANSCGFNSVGEIYANVLNDWDEEVRDVNHPDIGADEFTPTGRSGRYLWRGWTSENWDTNTNWQCELTPTDNPGELILIPEVDSVATIMRALPATTVLTDNLEIRPNAELIILPGNSLTLSGNLLLNGNLTLETPMNETEAVGSFIDNGTITGTGKMVAKRFINGGQYHEVSSPIKAGTGNNTSAIFTRSNPSGNYNPNLYAYNETVDLDGNVNTEPAGAFDNNNLALGWYEEHNGESGADINLIENKGYMFYTDMYQILQFEGEPATGDFDATGLSFTNNDPDDDNSGNDPTQYNLYDGWHLLGNPYPSSINWILIKDGHISGIDDGIYVWDNTGYSGYKNGSQVQNGNLTNNIPPMQGFFVRTNGGATPPAIGGQNFVGSVEIKNEHRTHSTANYLKEAYNHSNYLKLKTSANGHNDFIVVQFLPDATNEYDGAYDLVRMFVNPSYGDATLPQLYSITENENDPLALSVLPENEMDGKIVPLGLNIGQAGNYTISVDEFNDFNNIHVYFNDNLQNEKINLRNTNSYNFDFAGGKVDDRFYLNFEGNHAPILENQITDKEIFEDEQFTFAFAENTFIDEDLGDILRYEIINLPNWLSFNSDTRTFTGLPENENVGEMELQIVAFDMFNESDTTNFKIKIINTNDAPIVANQIPDMQTNAGEIYSYQIPENIFYDIDLGDNLTLKANLEGGYLLPNWLSFNSETKTLSGKPINAQTIDIKITATDMAGESVSDIFELTVLESLNISRNNNVEIEIYPNPASDFIFINLNKIKNTNLKITDVNGKTILEKNIVSNETKIDISKFALGTYFIKIQNETETFIEKIVKK